MASATEKVFAITELLEQILFYVGEGDPCADGGNPVEELFALQRVNHTFEDTIQGSFNLRRMMGLEHDVTTTEPRQPSGSPKHYLLFRLDSADPQHPSGMLSITAFTFNGDIDILCKQRLITTLGSSAQLSNLGIRSRRSNQVYSGRHDSWRKIRLSPSHAPVRVALSTHIGNASSLGILSRFLSVDYCYGIPVKKEGTLGALAEALEGSTRISTAQQLFLRLVVLLWGYFENVPPNELVFSAMMRSTGAGILGLMSGLSVLVLGWMPTFYLFTVFHLSNYWVGVPHGVGVHSITARLIRLAKMKRISREPIGCPNFVLLILIGCMWAVEVVLVICPIITVLAEELLEHILLSLAPVEHHQTCTLTKELFALQRVNRTFKDTIEGSQKLRVCMGTSDISISPSSIGFENGYDENPIEPDDRESGQESLDVTRLTPTLFWPEISLLPFSRKKGHRVEFGSLHVHFNLDVKAAFSVDSKIERPLSIGFRGASGRPYAKRDHSWRRIKISLLDHQTWLHIDKCPVRSRDQSVARLKTDSNDETLIFDRGDATLGDLADIIEIAFDSAHQYHMRASPGYGPPGYVSKSDLGVRSASFEAGAITQPVNVVVNQGDTIEATNESERLDLHSRKYSQPPKERQDVAESKGQIEPPSFKEPQGPQHSDRRHESKTSPHNLLSRAALVHASKVVFKEMDNAMESAVSHPEPQIPLQDSDWLTESEEQSLPGTPNHEQEPQPPSDDLIPTPSTRRACQHESSKRGAQASIAAIVQSTNRRAVASFDASVEISFTFRPVRATLWLVLVTILVIFFVQALRWLVLALDLPEDRALLSVAGSLFILLLAVYL
ncbi:hypothetical protein LTR37_018697 [Vermiconidia calcicola]|uniref:Uncharacterized protein n=1 Tax=Vermiconidia calcicola TaxID=1690605 RepID=A0ACC3MGC4_9PEZI|nr:hypothetical protein LTR37_018697 [Vermiconidia calcicola]